MDFCCVINLASFHYAQIVTAVFVGEVFGGKIVICFPEDIFKWFADRLAELLIGKGKDALKVFTNYVLWDGFDQGMVEQFGVAQGFFCFLFLRDIDHSTFVIQ